MKVTHRIATYTPTGEPVLLFKVINDAGAYVEFTNWGARWIAAVVPDTNGQMANVIVGYDTLQEYLSDTFYMGATIGRFANRIANASFVIDDITYQLEANDGCNTNHGGSTGFHQKLWQWELLPNGVRFTLTSPHGEGGYPGNLDVVVGYCWNECNELTVTHSAESDKPTYLNMTNHAYFNLSGTKQKVTSHLLTIPSERVLDTTPAFIPTGKIIPVTNTPFDFTHRREIEWGLYADNKQLHNNRGYNHCYVLKECPSCDMLQAASLCEPVSRRQMTIMTDLPGVLLYTAGYYKLPDTAVCLETQYFPDTSSHSHFPACLLRPERAYNQCTIYKFDIDRAEVY